MDRQLQAKMQRGESLAGDATDFGVVRSPDQAPHTRELVRAGRFWRGIVLRKLAEGWQYVLVPLLGPAQVQQPPPGFPCLPCCGRRSPPSFSMTGSRLLAA